MLFHDDEKGHVIIGEAAVNLALGKKEISVSSLIAELSQMAESKAGEDRLAQIADARRWLREFMQPGRRDQAVLHWLTVAGPDDGGKHSTDVIRLRPEDDDER